MANKMRVRLKANVNKYSYALIFFKVLGFNRNEPITDNPFRQKNRLAGFASALRNDLLACPSESFATAKAGSWSHFLGGISSDQDNIRRALQK
jgi:hypothetical protein